MIRSNSIAFRDAIIPIVNNFGRSWLNSIVVLYMSYFCEKLTKKLERDTVFVFDKTKSFNTYSLSILNRPVSHSARHQRPARERHKIRIASRENVDNQAPRNTNFTH